MSPSTSSLTMKPKPRVASNHLTVPVTRVSASPSVVRRRRRSPGRRRPLSWHAPARDIINGRSTTSTAEANMLFAICEPSAFSHSSAPGLRPGAASTSRRARPHRMAGAQHRRERLLARRPVGLLGRERARSARRSAKRSAAAQRRLPRACSRASRRPPRRSRPRAAPGRRAARHSRAGPARRARAVGKGAVVDIAERGQPLDQRLDRRLALARPSRARAACGRDRRRASRGSSRSARHRTSASRSSASRIERRRRRLAAGAVTHRHDCATVEPDYERASLVWG